MINFLLDKKITNKKNVDLFTKYSVQIPLEDMQTFEDFENKLNNDEFFRYDVVSITLNHILRSYIVLYNNNLFLDI